MLLPGLSVIELMIEAERKGISSCCFSSETGKEALKLDGPEDSTRSIPKPSVMDVLDTLLACLVMASPPQKEELYDEQGERW